MPSFIKRLTQWRKNNISLPSESKFYSDEQLNPQHHENGWSKSKKFTRTSHKSMRHVSIIWFEPTYYIHSDYQQIADRLNEDCYKVHICTTINDCVKSLTNTVSNSKVYLLIPGMWAMDLFNRLQPSSILETSIDEIFVYSSSPQHYEFLREQNLCIQKIYPSIDDVENTIYQCIDKRCEVLRFYDQQNVRDLSSEDTTAEFIWFIAFKDAIFHISRGEQAKNDMLDVCRRFHKNNHAQLAFLDEFIIKYQSKDAPKWYSRSACLYKLVNQALRTQDVEQLYVFRYFIADLSSWLSANFNKITSYRKNFYLYRGAALSQHDFHSLDREKLLAPNGFFSTSRNIDVAKCYIGSGRSNTVRVLYKIKCEIARYSYEEIQDLVAFADISEYSYIPDEEEVLFDLGAIFEIEYIEPPSSKNDYFIIHLIPSGKGTHISRDYCQNCAEEMENSNPALTFGVLLFKTGRYMAARHYFEQLFKDTNNENNSDIYHYLGWTHMLQGDHGRAIMNFERAHDLIPQSDTISRARVLNSIGKTLIEKGFVKESLNYYEKALHFRITALGYNHKDVVESFDNVARVHKLTGNSESALEYYKNSARTIITSTKLVHRTSDIETTDDINSIKSCRGSIFVFDEYDHLSKGMSRSYSLYELGFTQCEMGESELGLRNMAQSLDIDKYSSCYDISDGFSSFHALGNVTPIISPDSKLIEYQLLHLKHVKKHCSEFGTEVIDALENVGSAYTADRRFEEALSYYLSSLSKLEKHEGNFKHSLRIARTLNLIGDTYNCLYKFDDALHYYTRAINIYKMFPSETNRDYLRTKEKINKVNNDISLNTNIVNTTRILRKSTTSTSLLSNTKEKKNIRRSQVIRSKMSLLRDVIGFTQNQTFSDSDDLE